jgi:hypothetical protein
LKARVLFNFCLLILATVITTANQTIAQNYAGFKCYLVDSLDFSELDLADSLIIEKELAIYHSDKADI